MPGNVYAQPLYWRPAGAAGGRVIVATEDNVVAALDAVTGRTVWQQSLGPPAMSAAQPCGNIDPLGITGTPVIDERRGALYLDAMVDRTADRGTSYSACRSPTARCCRAGRWTWPTRCAPSA